MLQVVVASDIIIIQVSNEKRSKINPPVFLSSFNYDNTLEKVCKGKDEINLCLYRFSCVGAQGKKNCENTIFTNEITLHDSKVQ